jgi:hypothetical protein
MNNPKRASLRPKNNDGGPASAMLNRGINIPYREKWSFYDLTEWTGVVNLQSLVQALVTGILRIEDHETIEMILILGGLPCKAGPKEPIP